MADDDFARAIAAQQAGRQLVLGARSASTISTIRGVLRIGGPVTQPTVTAASTPTQRRSSPASTRAKSHNALYGKVIPLSALGLARIGTAGLIFGPYFNVPARASFAVSFGFPANPAGTRRVYEIALDGKVAWEIAAGSPAGALDAAGFSAIRSPAGSMPAPRRKAPIRWRSRMFGAQAVAYRPQMMLWFDNLPVAQFDGKVPFVSCKIGDVTGGAVPGDGINLGEALERVRLFALA